MESVDLFEIRESFLRQRVLLSFNGSISRGLIEEIGNALKNYLESSQAEPSAAMDVFSVYIEMTQNIRHYSHSKGYLETESSATLVVSTQLDGRYVVSAGNLVEESDGKSLCERVTYLSGFDRAGLKALFKEQLKKPRNDKSNHSAGLGLLDIARKSIVPLQVELRPLAQGKAFFSIRAVV